MSWPRPHSVTVAETRGRPDESVSMACGVYGRDHMAGQGLMNCAGGCFQTRCPRMKPRDGNADLPLVHLVLGTTGVSLTGDVRRLRWVRLYRLTWMSVTIAACVGMLIIRCPAQSNQPPVALNVVVGIPGTHLFAGLAPQGGQPPTNGNVVII